MRPVSIRVCFENKIINGAQYPFHILASFRYFEDDEKGFQDGKDKRTAMPISYL